MFGRDRKELMTMLGMFVNTLALRNRLTPDMCFEDFVKSVKENCVKAFAHELYPFDELVKDLNIKRDFSKNPLFDTCFEYQSNGLKAPLFDGLESTIYTSDANISKFDFDLEIIPQNNGEFDLNFTYSTSLFKSETANRIISHFIDIIKFFVHNSNAKIEDIEILPIRTLLENKCSKPVKVTEESSAMENRIEASYITASADTEKRLLNIWRNLFNLTKINTQDDFFNIGGDSLLCIKLTSRIYKEFGVKVSFKDIFSYPTIKSLSSLIDSLSINSKVISSTIPHCEEKDFYPASSAQTRTYLASQMNPNSTFYNIEGGLLLDEAPDISKLREAFKTVLLRHDALRTYFEVLNGEIVQKIVDDIDIDIKLQEVNTNEVDELFFIYISRFDLGKVPLFKMYLLSLPNGKFLLMLDVHHIIFDGTSLNNLIYEISCIYNGNELPSLDISYKDFAVWEEKALLDDGFKESKEFWLNEFKNEPTPLDLVSKENRPKVKSYEGSTFKLDLSKDYISKINKTAEKYGVTPFMLMLSSYYVLLYKYGNVEDITVGTPVSGRIYKELEPLIGMFVNSIPLRSHVTSSMRFSTLLENVKSTCIHAFAHQDYPFDLLVKELKLKKDSSRSPIFDTMFLYQNSGISELKLGEINALPLFPNSSTSKFDVSLEVFPLEHGFKLSFEYCTELFDKIFISNFAAHYKKILDEVLENPEILISSISILENNIRTEKVYRFNEITNRSFESLEKTDYIEATPSLSFEPTSDNNLSKGPISVIEDKNPIMQNVASAFENLLGIQAIGLDDNFFELGGDSLVAINLQIELMKQNLNVTYADIFENPTVRSLSEKLSLPNMIFKESSDTKDFSRFDKIFENTLDLPETLNKSKVRKYLTYRCNWLFRCTYFR